MPYVWTQILYPSQCFFSKVYTRHSVGPSVQLMDIVAELVPFGSLFPGRVAKAVVMNAIATAHFSVLLSRQEFGITWKVKKIFELVIIIIIISM